MLSTDVPTTRDGRAVPVAAFELALKRFSDGFPASVLSDRQQDAMLEVIIDLVSGGTTHLGALSDHAIRLAAQIGEREAEERNNTVFLADRAADGESHGIVIGAV